MSDNVRGLHIPLAFMIEHRTIEEPTIERLCTRFAGEEDDGIVVCEWCGTDMAIEDIEAGIAQCLCDRERDDPRFRETVIVLDPQGRI